MTAWTGLRLLGGLLFATVVNQAAFASPLDPPYVSDVGGNGGGMFLNAVSLSLEAGTLLPAEADGQVQSRPPAVPEPGTLPLVGLGVVLTGRLMASRRA